MNRIERYEQLRAAGDDGAVRRWGAWDPLGGVEVSLSTTSVADSNAEAIAGLRAEARRLAALGYEVRVFEDLERGLLGVAHRARSRPSPTRVEAPRSELVPSFSTASASHGTQAGARASRGWRWGVVAVGALGVVGAVIVVLARRGEPSDPGDGPAGADEPATEPRLRPSARASVSKGAPVGSAEPPPPGPSCDGVAISTGCIDLGPALAPDARACTSCPPPGDGDDVVVFDHSLDSPIRKELEACRARDRRPVADGPASCVRFAFAASYCESRGKRVPSEAEWKEGFSSGMTTDPALYEWTRDVVRERMNWTRGARGGSQADRNIRAPSLGFRCIR